MTDTPPKFKIYPSGSGFVTPAGIEIEYNSGCPRYVVASQGLPKPPIPAKYQILGAAHEDWYAGVLGDSVRDRELVIKQQLSDTVIYSGRADFVTKDGKVHETKASMSTSFLYQYLRKARVRVGHLAQLVSYMLQLKAREGVVVAGFYKVLGQPSPTEVRHYQVQIDDSGSIIVDGQPSGKTTQHQEAHLAVVKESLEGGELPSRPVNYSTWSGPCKRCPLNNLCWAKDYRNISDKDFIETARTILDPPKENV